MAMAPALGVEAVNQRAMVDLAPVQAAAVTLESVADMALAPDGIINNPLAVEASVDPSTQPLHRARRHSPRLASVEPALQESIIDKAIKCKEKCLQGSEKVNPVRLGELPSEDLDAVAVEANQPLCSQDVEALAAACDISARELGESQLALQESTSAP